MNIDEQVTEFRTSDFGCAASIITSGVRLTRLDRAADSRRVYFVFADKKLADIVSRGYFNDSLKLNPRRLFDNAKFLKSRLYGDM